MNFIQGFNIKATVNDINELLTIIDNNSSVFYDEPLEVFPTIQSLFSNTHDY